MSFKSFLQESIDMNAKRWAAAMAAVVGACGLAYGAYAQTGGGGVQPPRLIPYQGYLEDASGPVTAIGQEVTFFITNGPGVSYASPCNGSGGCLWQETDTINISNGYFSTVLGDGRSFPSSLFRGANRYLGVRIGDTTLDGKQRLLSSPYAITAETAQNFTVAGNLTVGGDINTFRAFASADIRSGGGIIAGSTEANPATGALIATAGARIGSHPRGNAPNGGDLVVGGGVEIGNHPDTGNPGNGTLYVAGNTDLNGNLHVEGELTGWDHSPNVISDGYSATQDGLGSDETIMTSAGSSFCALVFVELHDIGGSGNEGGSCQVKLDVSTNWKLIATVTDADAEVECAARCIVF